MSWYMEALRKYAVFAGRAQRKEYWFFVLINLIIGCVLGAVDAVAGTHSKNYAIGLFDGLYSLAVLIPSFAVTVRRLHDTGRSGWWLLIGIIPLLGAIVVIVWLAQDSNPGINKYGPNPKFGG